MESRLKHLDFSDWIYGILKSFIGGGAGAITTVFSASFIAPESFNFSGGLHRIFELMAATFLINGLLNFFYYLKQFPVPPIIDNNVASVKTTETVTMKTEGEKK
jgi:hypothetical protein